MGLQRAGRGIGDCAGAAEAEDRYLGNFQFSLLGNFVDEVAQPPDTEGQTHVRMVRLEVEGHKAR